MKRMHLISLLAVLLIASSCRVTEKQTVTIKTIDIKGAGVIHKPIVVDLDIQPEKITASASGSKRSSMYELRLEAVAKALEKSNADVLVDPKFTTQKSDRINTATVSGWPANYINFRSITHDDLDLLNVGVSQNVSVYEHQKEDKRLKQGAVAFFGGVASAILIALLFLPN